MNIEIKQPEIEITAHALDCKIDSLKAEILEDWCDDDKLELLFEYAMKLGEVYAQRDFNKKLEGCVVVPVEPTEGMVHAFEKGMLESEHFFGEFEAFNDGYKAMVEAARGGNE
ncbi:MAG: hypothetical protein LBQ29_08575 [Acinetobacter sp.]|jgi:hypothetical protein|uniref:hypothetical protein n=1 Tax=Acinetobacter sp. TaxID=472 RepID=UPI002828ACB0|nr:hypothetical protein [Acinetobacter sp.]MDR2061433.1 hypothetical protein [Acinetobacter sp.]